MLAWQNHLHRAFAALVIRFRLYVYELICPGPIKISVCLCAVHALRRCDFIARHSLVVIIIMQWTLADWASSSSSSTESCVRLFWVRIPFHMSSLCGSLCHLPVSGRLRMQRKIFYGILKETNCYAQSEKLSKLLYFCVFACVYDGLHLCPSNFRY